MFCIKIAGLPIGLDARYPYIRYLCQGYETKEAPLFTVRASEEELCREAEGDPSTPDPDPRSMGYYESLCLYRSLCLKLPEYDAFLIHGAVVALDGAAYVFCAPSGTGKTTHVRLWLDQFGPRAQIINGDKPVLRFIDGVLYACGTPWNGKERLGQNRICPVAGVCFLEQSPENQIRRLTGPEITRRIFHQLLLPREKGAFDCFWSLLDRMVQTVPFYLLACNREPDAAQLAYHTMRRNHDAENQTGFPAAPAGR